jgi:hypothetical protein
MLKGEGRTMTSAIRQFGDGVALEEQFPFDERAGLATARGGETASRPSTNDFDGVPAADWDLGRLGRRADFEGEQITACEIDAAPHYWIMGKVLPLAKCGVAHGGWGHWLRAHGIDRNRAYRARLLAAGFASLDQLEGLTLREAMKLALAARGVKPQDVKRIARRALTAMGKTLLRIQHEVKAPEDRAGLLPLIQAVEHGMASLRRAWEAP